MALTWKHPFTCLVSGPTGCGKTEFTMRLIKHSKEVIEPAPEQIIWCYGEYQDGFKRVSNTEFHEGIPDLSMLDGSSRTLLILDDLMHETDDRVTKIFTKISHHKNVSVLYLTQNLFHGGKENRTISLNAQYLVIFKNPRDATQIACLGRQMYPGKSKFLSEAFMDATIQPYSYIFIDLKPDTEQNHRLRSNVFPGEINYAYIPK
jgi:Adenovirus IVa2 protein